MVQTNLQANAEAPDLQQAAGQDDVAAKAQLRQKIVGQAMIGTPTGLRVLQAPSMWRRRRNHPLPARDIGMKKVHAANELLEPQKGQVSPADMDRCKVVVTDILGWALRHLHVVCIRALGQDDCAIHDQPVLEAILTEFLIKPMCRWGGSLLQAVVHSISSLRASPVKLGEHEDLQSGSAAIPNVRGKQTIDGFQHDACSLGKVFLHHAASQVTLVNISAFLEATICRSPRCGEQAKAKVLHGMIMLAIYHNDPICSFEEFDQIVHGLRG
mmetsp:Transcript_101101/g.240966  ORF Transcript_101101/g.240966 Transcript_101101/m.240966 type:complete len:270 (+) Transcript_101101:871-1680(+)